MWTWGKYWLIGGCSQCPRDSRVVVHPLLGETMSWVSTRILAGRVRSLSLVAGSKVTRTIINLLVEEGSSWHGLIWVPVCPKTFVGLPMDRTKACWWEGCRMFILLHLVSDYWSVSLVQRLEQDFWRAQPWPSEFYGWCLPTGMWKCVLSLLLGKALSRGSSWLRGS